MFTMTFHLKIHLTLIYININLDFNRTVFTVLINFIKQFVCINVYYVFIILYENNDLLLKRFS